MVLVFKAIDLIGQGYSETKACDTVCLNTGTFRKALSEHPEVKDLYDEHFMRGTDAMADALLEIDNHRLYGQTNPQMAKVISDNIKWLLSKRRPRDFGDKLEVIHSLTADKAIIQALNAGQQRALEAQKSVEVLDAQLVEETEEEKVFIT